MRDKRACWSGHARLPGSGGGRKGRLVDLACAYLAWSAWWDSLLRRTGRSGVRDAVAEAAWLRAASFIRCHGRPSRFYQEGHWRVEAPTAPRPQWRGL